jgi:hypothetical protein
MQPTHRQFEQHHVLAPKHSQYFLRQADFRHLHPTLCATPAPPTFPAAPIPPGMPMPPDVDLGGNPWNIPSLLFRYLLFNIGSSMSLTNLGRNAIGFLVIMALMARRRPSTFDSVFEQS